MKWWCAENYRDFDAVICDGAVRSGKTLSMSLGFVFWASLSFKDCTFAICGKTVTSLRRNIVVPLVNALSGYGFSCIEKISRSFIDITFRGVTNRFYLFGGKDEGSASLIQGITLAGVLLDEVPYATLFRGAGYSKVFRHRLKDVVQLQSRQPVTLVLQRVDKKG